MLAIVPTIAALIADDGYVFSFTLLLSWIVVGLLCFWHKGKARNRIGTFLIITGILAFYAVRGYYHFQKKVEPSPPVTEPKLNNPKNDKAQPSNEPHGKNEAV